MIWLRNHPGRPVTEADIAEIFAKAYGQTANYSNASSAFAKTGIHPFNPDIFTEEDFIASDVTDRPLNGETSFLEMPSCRYNDKLCCPLFCSKLIIDCLLDRCLSKCIC